MIQPLGNRVLVEQEVKELVQSGSIILADTVEDDFKLPKGLVIAIGEEIKSEILKPGDKIYFNELHGERIKHNEKTYLILKYSEILAKYDR